MLGEVMESIIGLAKSALTSIGAIQPLAIAAIAGLLLRQFEQIVLMTLGALALNQVVSIARVSMNENSSFTGTVNSRWQNFLTLQMQDFLAAFIGVGVVITLVYAIKLLIKKRA